MQKHGYAFSGDYETSVCGARLSKGENPFISCHNGIQLAAAVRIIVADLSRIMYDNRLFHSA